MKQGSDEYKLRRKYNREKNKEKYLTTEQRYRDRNRERIRNYINNYNRKKGIKERNKYIKQPIDNIEIINKSITICFG